MKKNTFLKNILHFFSSKISVVFSTIDGIFSVIVLLASERASFSKAGGSVQVSKYSVDSESGFNPSF